MAKASKRTIPESIKKQANEIVKSFNGNVIKDSQCYYTTRYTTILPQIFGKNRKLEPEELQKH